MPYYCLLLHCTLTSNEDTYKTFKKCKNKHLNKWTANLALKLRDLIFLKCQWTHEPKSKIILKKKKSTEYLGETWQTDAEVHQKEEMKRKIKYWRTRTMRGNCSVRWQKCKAISSKMGW